MNYPKKVKTTCAYCGVGCGLEVVPTPSDSYTIQGDRHHPANKGDLCPKGAFLGETLNHETRLLQPELYGEPSSIEEAVTKTAQKIKHALDNHGKESIHFYVSGQLLTEDYYVANKLMKGYIGTANIDTNSRLCMSSTSAGHKLAFGADIVPGVYEDLDQADLVVVVGSNITWCHPVLAKRIHKRKTPPTIVTIDPRSTEIARDSALHLQIKPGTDTILFAGLLHHIAQHGHLDLNYLDRHVDNSSKAIQSVKAYSITQVAVECGLPADEVSQFYRLFSQTEKVVTLFAQGINQSTNGTKKVQSIINCHLATGRIGKPGMGPFSLTGQANAMGGREMGGMAHLLTCHLDLNQQDHQQLTKDFWQSPSICSSPGVKATEVVDKILDGTIKVLWVMGTNPLISLPQSNRTKKAFQKLDTLIVSDCSQKNTSLEFAHIKLPAAPWSEKDGTVTNSERMISRQRAFAPMPDQVRADWWLVAKVAQKLGFQGFDYLHPSEIFREISELSGYRNKGERAFDISLYSNITKHEYDALTPFSWPVRQSTDIPKIKRFFGEGGFFTPNGKAQMAEVVAPSGKQQNSKKYPFLLNTGRMRDQWHTMTRSGLSHRLMRFQHTPFLEVSPIDLNLLNIEDNQLVLVESAHGKILTKVVQNQAQLSGHVFFPFHWNKSHSNQGCINKLVGPYYDPISGQPDYKATPVHIRPVSDTISGYIISKFPLELGPTLYLTKAHLGPFHHYEFAHSNQDHEWLTRLKNLISSKVQHLASYHDEQIGSYRYVGYQKGHAMVGLYYSQSSHIPDAKWLHNQFSHAPQTDQASLLSGHA